MNAVWVPSKDKVLTQGYYVVWDAFIERMAIVRVDANGGWGSPITPDYWLRLEPPTTEEA
jgi:hypothetical protein